LLNPNIGLVIANKFDISLFYKYLSQMIRYLFLAVILLSFTGCEKTNPVKKWTVEYRVYRLSNESISYRVQYETNSQATEFKGPFTNENWKSVEYPNFKDVSYQRLRVETISGKGEMQLQIIVNGSVYEEGKKGEYVNNFEIDSNL